MSKRGREHNILNICLGHIRNFAFIDDRQVFCMAKIQILCNVVPTLFVCFFILRGSLAVSHKKGRGHFAFRLTLNHLKVPPQ